MIVPQDGSLGVCLCVKMWSLKSIVYLNDMVVVVYALFWLFS